MKIPRFALAWLAVAATASAAPFTQTDNMKLKRLSDPQLSPDGRHVAYQVRQKVRIKGEEQELHAADSSTWVRGENGWECHAHSETFLTPGKEKAGA